ncbi:MAG: Sec-independent protein translocase protein TatB [Pseudomonadota bacterium]
MFDIGWTEMMVVAIVAILFVGPKELPGMLRTFGRAVKKIRGMAGEFQQQFDNALKEAELDSVKDSINSVRNLDPTKQIKDKLNPLKSDTGKGDAKAESPYDYDPNELFDASKDPAVEKAAEVDVEAALRAQSESNAPKTPPSSGQNAVPGFSAVPEKPVEAKPSPAKSSAKTASKKTAGKKPAAKKPTTKAASTRKPAAKSKPTVAAKPAVKSAASGKTAAKKPATNASTKTSGPKPAAKKPASKAPSATAAKKPARATKTARKAAAT